MNSLEGHPLVAFEEHLFICPECQDRVTETDSFLRGMRSALAVVPPEPFLSRWTSRWNLSQYFQLPMPVWATAAIAVVGLSAMVANYSLHLQNAPLAIALSATRGGPVPTAKAGTPLSLDLDARDLTPTAHNPIQIVSSEGEEVWSGTATAIDNGHLHVLVDQRLSPGQYYVRLADPVGARREYTLRLGN